MKDIKAILTSLGFLDSEVKVYLSSLKEGSTTIADLAKKTKLSRQAVYTAIEGLTERGLFSSNLRGKKRFYAAESPSKLVAYANRFAKDVSEKAVELEAAAGDLEMQAANQKPVVRVFEGKEGIKAILEDKRTTPFRDIMEIADVEALFSILSPEDVKPLRAQLKKRKVKTKGMYHGITEDRAEPGTRYLLPKSVKNFKADIGVYGDKIEMYTFEGKMHSVLIESKALAETMKVIFDLAFKALDNNSPSKK